MRKHGQTVERRYNPQLLLIYVKNKKGIKKETARMFFINIENATIQNTNYRRVLHTTPQMQVVVMNLQPMQEIGTEKHVNATQFIRVETGTGEARIFNQEKTKMRKVDLKPGIALVIHANTYHNIIAHEKGMQLYTVYSPPQHKDGLVQEEKPLQEE